MSIIEFVGTTVVPKFDHGWAWLPCRDGAGFTLTKVLGRSSYKNAQCIFDLHVKKASPEVASQPANSITMEQFVAMMRRLQEMGKGCTSNKLRSYARAAFGVAVRAKADASIPEKFLSFGVTYNPLNDTFVDSSANKADKNPLQPDQMRTYWNAIKDLPGLPGHALRLHLLTGAQRIEQLVRWRTAEIGADHILLLDGKGKPGKAPREHPVPLLPEAKAALEGCKPTGEYALSSDQGKTHISNTTLSKWAQAAVGDLIPNFQAKQLRSGVETLLAANKVDRESVAACKAMGFLAFRMCITTTTNTWLRSERLWICCTSLFQRSAMSKQIR